MKFIQSLDQIKKYQCDQVGGKGCTLARLRQAEFPVPPGFVVTADACRAYIAANSLDALITNALASGNPAMTSAFIRTIFEETEMPQSIAASICDAYLAVGGGKVAVRSSVLAKDGAFASLAGQHETFLEIIGHNSLLVAVRLCWASLWSERALAYRDRMDVDGALSMAVVVQRMASSAHAGVAFTLDPVSGRRDVVVVEAVAGTGEGPSGGQAVYHRYAISDKKESERLVQQTGGGVLDEARLADVVRLARDVESWAGQPQNVEWALDEAGNVQLLEARPITAVPTSQAGVAPLTDEPGFYWTRDNVGEVIPDPVTPLSWSVLDPLGNRSFASLLRRLGVGDYPDTGLFGRFYGRVYFNQTLFQGMLSNFYPSHVGWRAAPRLALTVLRASWLLHRLPVESERAISAILEHKRALPVVEQLADWRRLGTAAMEVHLAVSVIAELLYQVLDKLLARWGDGSINAAALTTGLAGVRSAETGQALAALARRVCQDETLCGLVLGTAPEALAARLAETDTGQKLWAQIEAFLVEHGHCAVQEFELAAPRWRDDASVIMGALQAHVRVVRGQTRGAQGQPRGVAPTGGDGARLQATARIEGRLGLPKRWFFRYLLRWTQYFIVTRENLKYHFVIAHSRLRDLYLSLADRFVAAGRLSDPADVFFLTADEVIALAEDKHETTLDGLVDERRRVWQTDQEATPPFAFEQQAGGRLCPVSPPAAPDGDAGQLLRGFAASPGSYTGRARVLHSPSDGATIEPGEVLVAPATSPGWAPLLLAAGALVTEIGGTLSHGAIIAREYGLPAVLNVAGATRHIRTGQLVRVDGSRGAVRLLEEAT